MALSINVEKSKNFGGFKESNILLVSNIKFCFYLINHVGSVLFLEWPTYPKFMFHHKFHPSILCKSKEKYFKDFLGTLLMFSRTMSS